MLVEARIRSSFGIPNARDAPQTVAFGHSDRLLRPDPVRLSIPIAPRSPSRPTLALSPSCSPPTPAPTLSPAPAHSPNDASPGPCYPEGPIWQTNRPSPLTFKSSMR